MNQAEENASLEAMLWDRLHGRVVLTPTEDRLRCLERTYLAECQTLAFRQRWGAQYAAPPYHMQWDPSDKEVEFQENIIKTMPMYQWIAMRAATTPSRVSRALKRISDIYDFRALLGLEDEPPVLHRFENNYELSSKA